MSENSVKLHRVLTASPEKVYRAFTESDALARWIAPDGFTCTIHSMEVKVGGKFKMSFKNFTTGKSHSFGGEYLELIPNEKLVYTDVFNDTNLPKTTVILKKVSCGADLTVLQENIPSIIPTEQCYLGWQQSLQYLAKLVEPNIEG
jgi:uncharacterized protein YndB with AHSA1/START domain